MKTKKQCVILHHNERHSPLTIKNKFLNHYRDNVYKVFKKTYTNSLKYFK